MGPYHDNPNWETESPTEEGEEWNRTLHTYYYKKVPFITHLKGGFSENKMSSKDFEKEFNDYLQELNNA